MMEFQMSILLLTLITGFVMGVVLTLLLMALFGGL